MNLPFETQSVCPECLGDIPAVVFEQHGNVIMSKECRAHGLWWATLEKDEEIYRTLRSSKAGIFPGHFINCTTRCDCKCSYCYYPVHGSKDVSAQSIIQEATEVGGPIVLTGGEPTLRKDLPELIERLVPHGGAIIPTNGRGLMNKGFMRDCFEHIGRYEGAACVALAHHTGQNEGCFGVVIDNIRSLGERIVSSSCVFKSLEELPAIIERSNGLRDCTVTTRIHVETEFWESKAGSTIFMSEILKWFSDYAKQNGKRFHWFPKYSKTMWMILSYDGLIFDVCRWDTNKTIDLPNCEVQPTSKAHNGELVHLTHAGMINEAMQRGWNRGKRIEQEALVHA